MKNYLLSLLLLSLIVLSACAPTTTPQDDTVPVVDSKQGTYLQKTSTIGEDQELQAFSSLEEYEAFANTGTSGGNYYGGMYSLVRSTGIAVDFAESAPVALEATSSKSVASDSADGGSTGDFSETNNQVQGVDEADIIKTDGEYIYTITEKTLFIVSAGEDAEVVSRISLEGYASGLFITDDKLAIFGYEYDEDVYDTIGFRPQNGMTYFHVYDMSDRKNLELIEKYSFEGNYFNARMIEDQVYFVLQSSPEYRAIYPLPIVLRNDVATSLPVDKIMWYPGNYNNAQLVTIHSIDLSGDEDVESLSVAVDNAQTLYMSANNMFILGNEYISEYEIEQEVTKDILEVDLSVDDKNLITLIESIDNRVLSQGEKEQKILEVYYQRMNHLSNDKQKQLTKDIDAELAKRLKAIDYFVYTTVTKVNADDGELEYIASGKVPGRTVNQFSLDEYNDDLRIATTVDARWSRFGTQSESYTNVFVLDAQLKQIGELTELAPTERIYSTRFVDERLYMVTFRQVDPFFVIDLSVPSAPKELGELKIPGFSRYLHPYDENHIIGIGREATELGRTTGLKISIFNVEDVANPVEVAKFVTEERYASSSALYEHKAFLFSREKNLLVIPAYSWGYDGGDKYNGAFVFDISKDNIELRGLIDHSSGSKYFQQVERSLFIDDLLYTKSPELLRVNSLVDLEGVADVDLKPKVGIPIF